MSTHYRAVVDVVREQLVGIMAGGLMDGHSWLEERTGATEAPEVRLSIGNTTSAPPGVCTVSNAQTCPTCSSHGKASKTWHDTKIVRAKMPVLWDVSPKCCKQSSLR